MELHILFGQRKQDYDGQYGPEALVCWDEFCLEENPQGFEDACEKVRKELGSDFTAMRVIVVKVDGNKIAKLLNKAPEIEGVVQP